MLSIKRLALRLLPGMHMAWLLLLTAGWIMAACRSEAPTPTRPPSPTIPPIITRIVTPVPPTVPPTPTLPYDLIPVEGRWFVRVDLVITGSSLADELRYSGSATFAVTLDGTVSGTGTFSSAISDPPCNADVASDGALPFTLDGSTYEEEGLIGVTVTLLPDNPAQSERFTIACANPDTIDTIDQPVLWPLLTTLDPRTLDALTINALSWKIPLQTNTSYHFEAELATETDGLLDGQLEANIRVGRG